MHFTIRIEPEAGEDIQEGIDWYNEQQTGLGKEFHAAVKAHIKKLQTNPFYQVRYDNVHCLPLKKYPYMIHFTINEESRVVVVHAVLNTSRDPKIWKDRR
jgi:mRNA-degrading endonuclease RelE of RelBE toxin-antitoxin system